jgi:circadian clock protein KaiA
MALPAASVSRPQILICTLLSSEVLTQQLDKVLESDRYSVLHSCQPEDFFATIERERLTLDCVILEQQPALAVTIHRLHREATLLPAIILTSEETAENKLASLQQTEVKGLNPLEDARYHTAEVILTPTQLEHLPQHIEGAISQFLRLSPAWRLLQQHAEEHGISASTFEETLTTQQHRLSEKLRERLGYLGVYYKRDPQQFWRNLSESEREQLSHELRSDYQDIILTYFRKETEVNQKIDAFVNKMFFADISVSQVLEMHMELMERFAKKLKLEGRNEDILLDYRLTLIDTIAHLCEMYRRSIPRES